MQSSIDGMVKQRIINIESHQIQDRVSKTSTKRHFDQSIFIESVFCEEIGRRKDWTRPYDANRSFFWLARFVTGIPIVSLISGDERCVINSGQTKTDSSSSPFPCDSVFPGTIENSSDTLLATPPSQSCYLDPTHPLKDATTRLIQMTAYHDHRSRS